MARTTQRRPKRGLYGSEPEAASSPENLLGWTVFIVLLIGLVLLCWLGSFYVFGHPEQPLSYSILSKLKKLDPPKRFIETAAPRGEFLDAEKLLARYVGKSDRDLEKISGELLRNYIRNYKQTKELVPYAIGNFNILDSYQLTENDLFQSGVVALAQSADNPQVLLEYVFPAEAKEIPSVHRQLLTGFPLPPLRRSYDLTAIIHIERLPDGRLKFTGVPLNYPGWTATEGPGGFTLEPPAQLNVEAGLPLLSRAKIEEADERYAAYRRKVGIEPGGTVKAASQFVRVEPAVPPGRGATPAPSAPATQESVAITPESSPVVRRAVPPETPSAPPVVAEANPPAVPPPTAASDVQLKPFEAATQPQPTGPSITNARAGSWRTYAPGRMPRGRLIQVGDAARMVNTGVGEDPTYLQGNFVVSTSGNNRAVLYSQSGGPLGKNQNVRVIVDFPAGSPLPATGANVARNSSRPFLVYKVERAPDGRTVNVWVKEITSE
jgi:hypothetical protein